MVSDYFKTVSDHFKTLSVHLVDPIELVTVRLSQLKICIFLEFRDQNQILGFSKK